MLHTSPNTLHLTQLSPEAIAQLSPSFETLPKTEHADGQYRLRRYSVVAIQSGQVQSLGKSEFVQSGDINRFQGDVVRQFEPIETATLDSIGMQEMCAMFARSNHLPDGHEIEIHQIRISAVYEKTEVAPEGVHQDGFEHIAIVGIDRHNIEGGDILLYLEFNEAPFFRKVLENGEVAMLADSVLWHNARPIRTVKEEEQGHMDVFVLTAKGANHVLQS